MRVRSPLGFILVPIFLLAIVQSQPDAARAEEMMRHDGDMGRRGGGIGGGIIGIGAGIMIDELARHRADQKTDDRKVAKTPKRVSKKGDAARPPAREEAKQKGGSREPTANANHDEPPASGKQPDPTPPAADNPPSQTVDNPPPGPPPTTATGTPPTDLPKTTEKKDEPKGGGKPVSPPPNLVVEFDPPKICGPDVTELVLKTLRDIKNEFENVSDQVGRDRACANMHSYPGGIDAWDIKALGPETSPSAYSNGKTDTFNPATNSWKRPNGTLFSPWLSGISNACAVPRPECAHTVEFMGTCQHAQVLNYIMWGVMTRLCPNVDNAIVRAGYAKAKALRNHQWTGDYEPTEDLMIDVGDAYFDEMVKNPDNPDVKDIGASLRLRYKTMFGLNLPPEQQCLPKCHLTAAEQNALADKFKGFRWKGLPGHRF